MNLSELLNIRLYNQLLTVHQIKEPHEIVAWMGAMQSQTLDMAKWAIGPRLKPTYQSYAKQSGADVAHI
ncbi:MAG: hypothetical protein VB102_13365 [Paludibacter sp.]|nr:hypothetical protein [Paludibacter sp.]